jgi:Na+-driven multidrug efflux pump
MVNAPQTQKNRRPAWFWLLVAFCGVASILFAAFFLIVEELCGAPNEGSVYFWLFEGFFALVGLFLIIFGVAFLVRAGSERGSPTFWLWVSISGMLSILFAIFCLLLYTTNHGETGFNLGGVIFWSYESLFAILGLFLVSLGFTRIQKPANEP